MCSEESLPIAAIEIDMSGCAYTDNLPELLDGELSALAPTNCRGYWAPAAGPELIINVVLKIIADAAAEWAVGKALDKILEILTKHLRNEPVLETIEIQQSAYSVRIMDRSFIDGAEQVVNSAMDERVDMLQAVREYVGDESRKGMKIKRVTYPCAIEEKFPERRCIVGYGSPELWLVEYDDDNGCREILYDHAAGKAIEGITSWSGRE